MSSLTRIRRESQIPLYLPGVAACGQDVGSGFDRSEFASQLHHSLVIWFGAKDLTLQELGFALRDDALLSWTI